MATQKQIDYILGLVNRNHQTRYRYLSQARHVLGLSSFQLQRGLSKAQASAIIDRLK